MTAQPSPAFRLDIQALRGLAVLFVLAYHAKITGFEAGYLGVDIFFVISGYLITNLIARNIERRNFSFSEFYIRRAKRLFPAAYATFMLAALFSAILLTNDVLQDFIKQLIGALTFTANIVLYRQTGYFLGAAELKPLLHVWSLSLEEQYYMLIPAALFFTPRRYWLIGMTVLLVSSLGLCLVLAPLKPDASFYLLPTRGWEFAIGSLGALGATKYIPEKVLGALFWPAVLLLFVVPCKSTGYFHPGPDAILVCIATLIIIISPQHKVENTSLAKYFARVGDFSYSLYLVHWPLFAFLNNAWVSYDVVPVLWRASALGMSLLLGYLMYLWVELPVRQSKFRPTVKTLAATVCVSAVLLGAYMAVCARETQQMDFHEIGRNKTGFSDACASIEAFISAESCSNSKRPKILIWGDSFAMALVAGVVATTEAGVVQATASTCGPILNVAPIANQTLSSTNIHWAVWCISHNQSVLDYIARTPSIEVVVLTSAFIQYQNALLYHQLVLLDGRFQERQANSKNTVAAQVLTINKIRQLGRRVVLVAPPPSADFDIFRCVERKLSGKAILGAPNSCEIPIADYHKVRAPVIDFLKQVEVKTDVQLIRFDEYLCGTVSCATYLDKTFIYREGSHLSYGGVRLLAKQMNLGGQIYPTAVSSVGN